MITTISQDRGGPANPCRTERRFRTPPLLFLLAGCGIVFFTQGLYGGDTPREQSVRAVVAEARDIIVPERASMIEQQIVATRYLTSIGPEGVAKAKERLLKSLEDGSLSDYDRRHLSEYERMIRSACRYNMRLASHLAKLAQLRAVEAAELGLEHIDIVRRTGPSRRRTTTQPGVELLKAAGRPAAALIIHRLASDKELSNADRQRLLDVLQQIEGPASQPLLKTPPPLPPRRPSPAAPVKNSLEVRFIRLPGIRCPGYLGHSTKSVLNFSKGKAVEGPVINEGDSIWTNDDTEPTNRFIAKGVGKTGDFAFFYRETFVPSRMFAHLETKGLYDLSGKDLSGRIKVDLSSPFDARTARTGSLKRGEIILVVTRDNKFALVQRLGVILGKEIPLAYVFQPNGSARFPIAPWRGDLSYVLETPSPSFGNWMAAHFFVAYPTGYYRSTQSLQKVLDGTIPDASLSEKAEALRLLGSLRCFEAAELMISYLATAFPGAESISKHPAVLALADIEPAARPVLLQHIKNATDKKQRERLVDTLMYIEGDVAGKALLLADGVQTETRPEGIEAKGERSQAEQAVHEVWMPDCSYELPSVLQIVSGQLRPAIRKEIKPEEADSVELWATIVREAGDIAWDSSGGDMLVASGRLAVLSETTLDTLADQDLSDRLQNKFIISRVEGRRGTYVLLKTVGGTYALLQIGTAHKRRLQVFWICQPNGSARFSQTALTALAAAGKPPTATISVLTDLGSPEGRLLDMNLATLLPSPIKMPGPLESEEDALRTIRQVADLAYWNGRLLAGSEKMAFRGRGQLPDLAETNAAEAIRRRGRPWLRLRNIEPGRVFVVMTRDGKYALCRVVAKQGGTISIRWVMQRSGKSTFPIVTPDPPLKATSTLFDKLPKDPTARLQRLVSTPPPGQFGGPTDRTPLLAEIHRVLSAGADPKAFREPLGYNALHLAANSGATDAAELLLNAGMKVDSRSRGGVTALNIAAYMNHYELCKLLLRHGADPQAKSPSGETPLAAALRRPADDKRIVQLLTESGGRAQSLHVAALAGDVDQIKAILAKGASVNQRDPQGKTPLYIAAEQGKAGAVALLLDAKADTSMGVRRAQQDWTPLIAAAHEGHAEVVQLLLTKAAKIAAEEKHKALYWAVLKRHVKVCQVLVEHGAPYRERMEGDGPSSILEIAWYSPNPDIPALFRTRGEQMPLWAACQLSDTKTVQKLLATPGVNPNERSPRGDAPLHLAVRGGHLDLAEMLLDKGADINLPMAHTKKTALHLAVEAKNLAAVKLLIARHANLNALTMGGRTPLYYAAVLRSSASIVVRTLLDAGADVGLVPSGDQRSGKKLSELTRDKTIQRMLQEHEEARERK